MFVNSEEKEGDKMAEADMKDKIIYMLDSMDDHKLRIVYQLTMRLFINL